MSAICARICSAPSAQFKPTETGDGVPDRVPERLRRLAGQQPPGAVGDGAGDHHRHVDAARRALLGDGVDRGLGVERVEDRLDQQQVRAAGQQPAHLLAVGVARSWSKVMARKPGLATSGEIDAVRLVGPSAPATKRGLPSSRAALVRRLARQPRALAVELIGDVRHAVVGLRDRGRRERVGRDDVGAGLVVGVVNFADRVGAGSGSSRSLLPRTSRFQASKRAPR